MIYKPYEYQTQATKWIINRKRCALFLDMGLGKSVITLTAIQRLTDYCEVGKVLVVAPKKVAETTWTGEADKWEHLSLTVSKVMGTAKQRVAALCQKADVYVIGRDSFVWLVGYYNGTPPFDMIVIDELTSFKSPKSQRFKAMRMVTASADRVVGLTGTPAPNGLIDLWAQIYCLDMGERLGKSVSRYRDTYFELYRWNNIIVRCTLKKGAEDIIRNKIADICLSMQSKDYLQLPDLLVHDVRCALSDKTMSGYNEFERERVMEFEDEHKEGEPIIANSVAALMNKLSQYASGAVYDSDGNAVHVHDEKLEVLDELIEAAEGNSVLVFYQYRHEVPRIKERLKGKTVVEYKDGETLKQWNDGKIDVLLAHPASTAFGLNMQQGGHYIIWFGTGWNLELYQQANARLHRQGQTQPVHVYRIICTDTVDERAVSALDGKKDMQQALMDDLNFLKRKYEEKQQRPGIPGIDKESQMAEA